MRRLALVAAMVGVGCAGDDLTTSDDTTELTLCEGAGDPLVEAGEGSRDAFVAFDEGDDLVIDQDGSGQYGFGFDVLTEGLDTTEAMTAVVRITLGSDPSEDFVASLILQCPDEGPGWTSVFAPLDESLQDEVAAQALVGQPVELSVTLTEQAGSAESASHVIDMFVGWPATAR